MFSPLTLLSARFLKSAGSEKVISRTFLFCMSIIALTTCALTLIISIMLGFEAALNKTLQTMQPDIIIKAPAGKIIDIETIIPAIEKNKEIKAVSWQTIEHILVRSKKSDFIAVALIKGITPQREISTTNIAQTMLHDKSEKNFVNKVADNKIIIGTMLAQDLNCSIGDQVELLIPSDFQTKGNKLILDSDNAIIGGIFKTGLDDVDSSLIMCNITFLKELFPETEPTSISISLNNKDKEQIVIKQLKELFHLPTFSWKELYPALIAAMKLEKYAMILILSILAILACLTISSSIALLITQKKRDIAILKAFGASNIFLKSVFLAIGSIIGIMGTAFGIVVALLFSSFLNKYPIPLPDAYFVSHIPIIIEWSIIVIVVTVILFLIFVTTLLVIKQIKYIEIAKSLKSE